MKLFTGTVALVAGLILAGSACAAGATVSAARPQHPVRLVIADAFSVESSPAPAWAAHSAIDSSTGTIKIGTLSLEYDYGAYSDPLQRQDGDTQYHVKQVEIAGQPARIVYVHAPGRFPHRPYVIGVHFPALGRSVLGTTKLTVICALDSAADYPAAEKILRSIRFLKPAEETL